MSPDETQTVFDKLVAGWQNIDMPPEKARVWFSVIEKIPFESGMGAVDALINTENFFPTIAKFRGAVAAQRRTERFEWYGASACQLCEGRALVKDAEGRDYICSCAGFALVSKVEPEGIAPPLNAALRELLKRMGGQEHRHNPGPCPVCGGSKPTLT